MSEAALSILTVRTFGWVVRLSPPAKHYVSTIVKYLSDMEEIYDKAALKENIERIENMTVSEIRKGLPEGYAFMIYGDSYWAILKRDEIKTDNL